MYLTDDFDLDSHNELINNIVNFLADRIKVVGYWDELVSQLLPTSLCHVDGYPKSMQLKIFINYDNPPLQRRVFCFPDTSNFNGTTLCVVLKDNEFCILRH